MMKGATVLRVTATGYEPADEDGRAQHAKMKLGDCVAARISRPRSLPQLRLYWAVLTFVADATHWETPERLHAALKVKLGLYDLLALPSGKMVPVVQSAAFDAMTQDEFQSYVNKAIDLICADVLEGYDAQRLIQEVGVVQNA